MSEEFIAPKGWRKLRPNAYVERGDKYWSNLHEQWWPTSYFRSDYQTGSRTKLAYIRRKSLSRSARLPKKGRG